jgi:hypothetical protein
MHEMRLDQNQTFVALSVSGANIATRGSSFRGGRGSRPFRPHAGLCLLPSHGYSSSQSIKEGGVAGTLLQHLAPPVNYARNRTMWPMIAISDTIMVFK